MMRFAGAYGPWILAGALAVVSIVTTVRPIGPDPHGLVDEGTVIASFWAIARHYRGPRLKPGEGYVRLAPGQQVLTAEQACELAEAGARGAAIAERDRRLHSLTDRRGA